MFIVKMADHGGNHRCLVEKNVPIAFILPSRWQDGAESLGIERLHNLFMLLMSYIDPEKVGVYFLRILIFEIRTFDIFQQKIKS